MSVSGDLELYVESWRVVFAVLLLCFLTLNVASVLVILLPRLPQGTELSGAWCAGRECVVSQALWAGSCLQDCVSLVRGFGFTQTLSLNPDSAPESLLGRSLASLTFVSFPGKWGTKACYAAWDLANAQGGGSVISAALRGALGPKQTLPQPAS